MENGLARLFLNKQKANLQEHCDVDLLFAVIPHGPQICNVVGGRQRQRQGEVNVVCNWWLELVVPVRVTTPRPRSLSTLLWCTCVRGSRLLWTSCCLGDNAWLMKLSTNRVHILRGLSVVHYFIFAILGSSIAVNKSRFETDWILM